MRIPPKLTGTLTGTLTAATAALTAALNAALTQARYPQRWKDWWLELSSVIVVAIVLIICVAHLWTAPLLLGPLLAVPPALAGIGAATLRRPVGYGALSLLAAVIIAVVATGSTHWLPEATIVTVVIVTGVSAAGTALSQRKDQHLANVVSVAEAAQRAVMRPLPEAVGPLQLDVVYLAAAADAKVGGDLYDVANTPHGIRAIIGDVRGKGLGAVEVAADVLGMFRQTAHEVHTLAELARRLDAGLARNWGEHEEFVTALLAEIDPETGKGEIFSCGHPPAMQVTRRDGQAHVEALEVRAPAPPLGLMTLGNLSGASEKLDLKPNDMLLFYTDGVTEARDKARDFYPLQARLSTLAHLDASGDLLGRLRADLLRYVGSPLGDDAALLLVRAPAAWPAASRGGRKAVTA
jgi:serine phosphatase RsbU (regulator of sigma subunit)